jgi:MFS family permease
MGTFLAAYAAGSYAPPSVIMAEDLGTTQLAVFVGITTFCFGFAMAPMALAPLSELWGRYPVIVAAGVVFVVFQAICSVVTNLAGMLVARLCVGIGASVFSSVVGGIIADLWTKAERNVPMALFSGSVLAGTGAGPLVASVMVRRLRTANGSLAWKWIFWHQVIALAVFMTSLILLFKESRDSVLLSRKAEVLNRWYEQLEELGHVGVVWTQSNPQLAASEEKPGVTSDEEKAISTTHAKEDGFSPCMVQQRIRWIVHGAERQSLTKMVLASVYRPFHMLVTEPIVFFFSLWSAFAWAMLYLTFGSISLVFARVHGMDIEESGYMFTAMIIGSVVATVAGIWQDKMLRHPQWKPRGTLDGQYSPSKFWEFMRRHFPADAPESRIYFACITAMLLPLGLFLFGFTARPDCLLDGPAVGIGLATWGIYSVYLATFNYLADSYQIYASSALAAQSCCRNLLGGGFSLVTHLIFRNLGEAGAGGMLGGIAMVLTVIPWALVFFGESVRRRSHFAIAHATP